MENKTTDRSNLIVNYLPQKFTERELYSMFVTIGPVESCRVVKDYKTGYSYGFGFVNYFKPEDAEQAIQKLNGQEIYNKRIKVSYARPSGEDIKDTNLYVCNLPKHFKESDLENLFSAYGKIVQKNLLLDKLTHLPRGVAFVRFDRREEAQEAIRNLDGQIPKGCNESLSVRVAQEHGKQKAAYYAGYQAGKQQIINGHGVPVQIGRGNIRCALGLSITNVYVRQMGVRNGYNKSFFNNGLGSYPIRFNVRGALKQEKLQLRYNPLSFGKTNNGYADF